MTAVIGGAAPARACAAPSRARAGNSPQAADDSALPIVAIFLEAYDRRHRRQPLRGLQWPHEHGSPGSVLARLNVMEANAAVLESAGEPNPSTKILLAIDESPCSEAAVKAVLNQFPPELSEVRVLHVDEWPKDMPTYLAFAEGPAAVSNIVSMHNERWRRGEELVSRAAHRLAAAKFRAKTEIRHGDARHEILDFAADWCPDVIVLGSHGRRGVDRFLLGSVSEGVVRHANCSVEVVRGPLPADTV
jgi:nucleotide-binding universal stress UspA family protein